MRITVYRPSALTAHYGVMTTSKQDRVSRHLSHGSGPWGSPAWAAAHAEELLAGMPEKWAHTQEVARHGRWVGPGIRPDDRDLLVAAYLHDIGYAAPIATTGFHPLDGARHLRSLGLNDLACLVAHHTGAHIEAEHRGLADELAEFRRPHGPVADALTYSDVTSGPTGRAVDPGDRFEEIVDRHGPDSIVAHSRAQGRTEMYGMVARTLRRATRNRELTEPLEITPVGLGCVTLVRFQGRLTTETADHTALALGAVLDRNPHAVVLDMAMLTGLDPTGADVLTDTARHTTISLVDPRGRDHAVLQQIDPPRPLHVVFGIETALTPHCT